MRFHATPDGDIPFTAAEEDEADAREAAYLADAPRRAALEAIAILEASITPRRLREAVLGVDNGWLAGVENQIALERAKL